MVPSLINKNSDLERQELDSASSEALVRQFQRGDNHAFEQFVQRYQDRIFRLANVYLYAPDDAADAAQEVFLRAYKGLHRFRFRSHPFTWLFGTLKNVCKEFNRKRERETALPDEYEREDMQTEMNTETEQHYRQIRQLVYQLPQRQRDVIILRIFEELSVQDTATAMGCRPGTIKALQHKAINKLKDRITIDHDILQKNP
jgi:RNA polymerase sigma-70 factor (ECF subfamily)